MVQLALSQFIDCPQLLDSSLLDSQLGVCRLLVDLQPLSLNLKTISQLFDRDFIQLHRKFRDQSLLGELRIGLQTQFGLVVVCLNSGRIGFLVELLAFKSDFEVHV